MIAQNIHQLDHDLEQTNQLQDIIQIDQYQTDNCLILIDLKVRFDFWKLMA